MAIAQTLSVVNNAVAQVEVDNPAIFTALTYHYYDQYDFVGVKNFDNSYSNLQAYGGSEPDVEPIQKKVIVPKIWLPAQKPGLLELTTFYSLHYITTKMEQ
ncbi:hypothetical protein [Paraflavitalea speifideaquila]|uniref:hypothetical protein n=1 Tax=Paraflavitalea speifideaquila TaxID=3076558 RepID=UPI0028E3D646|nr:hypothetical protein [Paraflavitalea speifideiaquila]